LKVLLVYIRTFQISFLIAFFIYQIGTMSSRLTDIVLYSEYAVWNITD